MVGQYENYVGLETSAALPFQGDNVQVQSSAINNRLNIPLRGVASSSIGVSMNTCVPVNRDKDWAEFLVPLHQQAKFWAIIIASLFPGFFSL